MFGGKNQTKFENWVHSFRFEQCGLRLFFSLQRFLFFTLQLLLIGAVFPQISSLEQLLQLTRFCSVPSCSTLCFFMCKGWIFVSYLALFCFLSGFCVIGVWSMKVLHVKVAKAPVYGTHSLIATQVCMASLCCCLSFFSASLFVYFNL